MNRTTHLDDLFVIECLKEVPGPQAPVWPEEQLVQNSAGQLFRCLTDSETLPFACATEFLATVLGRHFGLAVPEGQPLRFGHRWSYLQRYDASWEPFHPGAPDELADASACPAILAFDLWLGNVGRAQGGIVLARGAAEGAPAGPPPATAAATAAAAASATALAAAPPVTFELIRHQFAFIGLYDEDDEGGLIEAIAPTIAELAGHHPLCHTIRGQFDFDDVLRRFEALPSEQLRDFVRRVPGEWLSPGQKAQVFSYLDARRQRLRSLLPQLRPSCSSWE